MFVLEVGYRIAKVTNEPTIFRSQGPSSLKSLHSKGTPESYFLKLNFQEANIKVMTFIIISVILKYK